MLNMVTKCLLLLFCFVANATQYSYHRTRTCPYPHLENGRIRFKQRTRMVKFLCMPEYELVGNRYATCLAGNWDTPKPVCVKPGCPSFVLENAISLKNHHGAWVTTFCFPGYQLVGSAEMYCNGHQWNASIPECVSSSVTERLSCDFETPDLCGWKQDELHDFDWTRINTRTPSWFLSTGPKFDHTYGIGGLGYYMYIESTSKQTNDSARLVSPVYDSNLTTDGCFSFYYHMFGEGVGALRVYQKPEKVQMAELLNSTQYMLFEQPGNLGDFWYSAAVQLKDYGDDFQIVIEGVRGKTYTSDIAIDDVAILQGVNCTYFRNAGTTPVPPANAETCAGRCDSPLPVPHGCECGTSCVEKRTCCADYLDICVFGVTSSYSETTDTEDEEPQTEKLDNSTTAITTTSTSRPSSTSPATSTSTSTSTTTTSTTTTTTTTTTTPKPQTTPTTKKTIITTKPTKPTTKLTTKLTTSKPTTKQIATTKVTPKPPTVTTPTVLTTHTVSTTTMTTVIPTNGTVTKEEKQKGDKESGIQKMTSDKVVEIASKSSPWKTAIITVVCLGILAAVVFLGLASRSNSGRVTLARLRGRALATNDPEVRYLNSNDDDL